MNKFEEIYNKIISEESSRTSPHKAASSALTALKKYINELEETAKRDFDSSVLLFIQDIRRIKNLIAKIEGFKNE